ncbi:hypothetical protein [Paraburkholderia bannensis]|uniref:hypothetical protein n=1 Tax=Paraburkholderia bannensis TaxID=765414 RepID=UPI002AC33A90|nr:hypothetical protein [Paraburkholderia bannensis]
MRFILAGTMLCALASTALAGEHYTEIWNPPEARTPGAHPVSPSSDRKAHAHHTKKKLASVERPDTRKIAEPAMRAPAPTLPMTPNGAAGQGAAPGVATPGVKSKSDGLPEIPPQIGPDGNVLQVGYAVPARRQHSPLVPSLKALPNVPVAATARAQ